MVDNFDIDGGAALKSTDGRIQSPWHGLDIRGLDIQDILKPVFSKNVFLHTRNQISHN